MKHNTLPSLLALCLLATANAPATVRYVDVNSATPASPYTNWSTAAVTIQQAVDAAVTGDQILVTNGVYQTGGKIGPGTAGTNRVAVTKAVLVQSVNGPDVTVIKGYQVPVTTNDTSAIRCAYLTNGASLSGFTLTNGATVFAGEGGGVWCQSTNPVVTNCVLVANSANFSAGGAYQGTLNNCTLRGNSVTGINGYGGGGYLSALNNCTLTSNSAAVDGGGAWYSILNNCTLVGNSAQGAGGGASISTLRNCLLRGNSADQSGGGVGDGTLINCTLTGNSAAISGGGTSLYANLRNCIVYFNTAPQGANYFGAGGGLLYCCTTPQPTGTGCFTNAPLFVDQAGGNLRLQSNSPCINAGNNAYAAGSTDLDGRPRIVGGTVDIGTYESQPGVSGVFLGWLQQYGLPTDGSADYSDSDSDLMNNWQEWIAGTVPTDTSSALRLLDPTRAESGVTVSWQSVSNRTYFLERATNLGTAPPFSLLTSSLVGQAGTTSYTDPAAIGPGPFFYRVGVQP